MKFLPNFLTTLTTIMSKNSSKFSKYTPYNTKKYTKNFLLSILLLLSPTSIHHHLRRQPAVTGNSTDANCLPPFFSFLSLFPLLLSLILPSSSFLLFSSSLPSSLLPTLPPFSLLPPPSSLLCAMGRAREERKGDGKRRRG